MICGPDNTRLRLALAFGPVLLLGLLLTGQSVAATLTGSVTVEKNRRLKNIVIYLEPADGRKPVWPTRSITVSQKDTGFHPAFNVAVAGTTVRFANDEERNIDHNVYSLSPAKKFDVGLIGRGAAKGVVFDKVGTIKFYCSIHKSMEGVLNILPSPYFARLSKPGPFRIDGVPPGKWIIKALVTHRRYGAQPVPATVSEGVTTNLSVIVNKKHRRKRKKAGMPVQLAQGPVAITVSEEDPSPVSIRLSIEAGPE